MAKSPPKKPKDPAKPTRAKAARPDDKPTPDALANLLNPGIGRGTAGMGSGTGLQPPPDNSWDRRRDFSEAHKARKSTPKEFEEASQRDYTASPITGLDPALERELGLETDDGASPSPAGGGSRAES
ncbi:MAG: excinuclease ABC subunit UvrB, partial [Pseudolabrys sp.]